MPRTLSIKMDVSGSWVEMKFDNIKMLYGLKLHPVVAEPSTLGDYITAYCWSNDSDPSMKSTDDMVVEPVMLQVFFKCFEIADSGAGKHVLMNQKLSDDVPKGISLGGAALRLKYYSSTVLGRLTLVVD